MLYLPVYVCVLLVLQREAKVQLFREAADAYSALTDQVNEQTLSAAAVVICYHLMVSNFSFFFFQALKGHGIESHLLGLKLQAIEEGLSIPKIFMDTAYGLATHWKLRTGQVRV